MITLKKQGIADTVKTLCLGTFMGLASITCMAESSIDVRHLVSEQNILQIKEAKKYLLLPVQDNAPEGKIYFVINNQTVGSVINIRLAREKVDYYVPLDLSAYVGKDLSLDVQGMPESAICWKKMKLSDTFDTTNREKFRPLYHHTPAYGWMNDPNGMFYKDGVYHLYFQHNPYGSTWGNMTWGHSTTTDLVNWKFEGDAITPDAWGSIFSGSSVVDYENTAGFGEGAVIAFYTSAKPSPWGDVQMQSMAYSTDNGKTFTKYENNPIVTSEKRDFRDPKVFWYAPGKHWVMILAGGQEMDIYSSKNLKDWKYESSFGAKQGAHGGVWECPDLVELPVEGTKEKRWVLICNIFRGDIRRKDICQRVADTYQMDGLGQRPLCYGYVQQCARRALHRIGMDEQLAIPGCAAHVAIPGFEYHSTRFDPLPSGRGTVVALCPFARNRACTAGKHARASVQGKRFV